MFFLVATVQTCMVLQHLASRWLRRAPTLPRISDGFNWRSWAVGVLGGALLGALLAGAILTVAGLKGVQASGATPQLTEQGVALLGMLMVLEIAPEMETYGSITV